jgi:hypothetical protein
VLADLGLFLVGDRGELMVERSQQGAGFTTDTSNFRVRWRGDARYWIQESITLANGSVVSPIVILNSAT